MDLISVSIKKPFILDVSIVQIVVPAAITVAILPIARQDIIAIQLSVIDDLAKRISNIIIQKIDIQRTSGYIYKSGTQIRSSPLNSLLNRIQLAIQIERLDLAQNINQLETNSYYNQSLRQELSIYYFYRVASYISTQYYIKKEIIRRGQIYININNRIALRLTSQGGIEILFSRNELQVDIIKRFLKESQLIENLDKLAI